MKWRALVLAQSTEVPTSAYGLIAMAVVSLISGFVFVVKWLLTRVEAESAAKDELAHQLIDKVVPALTESTVVLKEAADLLREISIEGRRRMRNDQ